MSADHMPPPTPQELLSQMREKFHTFQSACMKLSAEQALKDGVCGQWSSKAVVDHLTGWQMESMPILSEILKSDQAGLDLDIDGFNRTSVMEREDLTWEESLTAFEQSFEIFDEHLGTITFSQYRTNAGLKSWMKAMIHEYQFHLQHVQHAGKF